MKLLLFILFSFQIAFAAEEDFKRVLSQKGLPAKVSIQVRDLDGNIVPNANVLMSFSVYNQRNSNIVEGKTDEAGIASGEALLNDKIAIHISKDGYYETFFRYNPWTNGCYDSGRWEPWNPMLNMVLIKKKNPQRIGRQYKVFQHLDASKRYGVDVLLGQIIVSTGENEQADFFITMTGSFYKKDTTFSDPWVKNMCISCPGEGDGFIRRARNTYSEFMFDYQAPPTGYTNSVFFSSARYNSTMSGKSFLADEEYMVFRISRKDENTGDVYHYYGVIEDVGCGKDWNTNESWLSIGYRVISVPDNPNIEFN